MLFVILEIVLALAIVGLIVFWVARPPKPPGPPDSSDSPDPPKE